MATTNWNTGVRQIPDEWRKTKGQGVKVAILDTGVFSGHSDLHGAIALSEDFTKVMDNIDYTGHGTHVAGLIGARSAATDGVVGVAPSAELLCLKVLPDNKDGGDAGIYQGMLDALDFAVKNGADVINMSLSLNADTEGESAAADQAIITALRNKIKEIGDKNIIMVAAGGDSGDLRNSKLFFPASCPEIISVASVSQGYFKRNPVYSKNLNIAGPTINYLSTFNAPLNYQQQEGCSMTTAFISGIIALAISVNRSMSAGRLSKVEMLELLNKYSMALDDIDYADDSTFCYHVLQNT